MSAPPFVVRHAIPSDGEPVRAFVKAILWSYALDAEHEDLNVFAVPFNGALAELVAVRDDVPIGMAALWPRGSDVGWVSKLFVDPEHRGLGVGRALLAAIEDEARAWGLRAIGLSTLPQLKEAVHLYESMGWRRRSRGGIDRVYWRTLR